MHSISNSEAVTSNFTSKWALWQLLSSEFGDIFQNNYLLEQSEQLLIFDFCTARILMERILTNSKNIPKLYFREKFTITFLKIVYKIAILKNPKKKKPFGKNSKI